MKWWKKGFTKWKLKSVIKNDLKMRSIISSIHLDVEILYAQPHSRLTRYLTFKKKQEIASQIQWKIEIHSRKDEGNEGRKWYRSIYLMFFFILCLLTLACGDSYSSFYYTYPSFLESSSSRFFFITQEMFYLKFNDAKSKSSVVLIRFYWCSA